MNDRRCGACKQVLPSPKKARRICSRCREPITRHHKWHHIFDQVAYRVVHRHCDNPKGYTKLKQA